MAKPRQVCRPCWQIAFSLGWFSSISGQSWLFTLLAARLVGERQSFELRTRSGKCGAASPQYPAQWFQDFSPCSNPACGLPGSVHFVASDSLTPDHGMGRFVENGAELAGSLVTCVSLDDFTKTAPCRTRSNATLRAPKSKFCAAQINYCKHRRPWIILEFIHPRTTMPRAAFSIAWLTSSPPPTTCTCWRSP